MSPIHVAVPNTAIVLGKLATVLETLTVLGLANAFFSILMAAESQDQFAFTQEGQQRTFQMLPQGYLHSPTTCHGMVRMCQSFLSQPQ